jgi:hypothetical protein
VLKIPFGKKAELFFGLLQESIFNEGSTVICWNIKQFFSFARHLTGKIFKSEAKIIDLQVRESYLGVSQKAPANWKEAMNRCRVFKEYQNDATKAIYDNIHLPLIREVIPEIESMGIMDADAKYPLHAYYTIEGQANGRLRCSKPTLKNFNPHSLGPKERKRYKPPGEDIWFLCFDFKNMEVRVLEWLSKDPKLGEFLARDQDFYEQLFEAILNKPCNEDRLREFAKDCFFPVIFGSAAPGVAKNLEISEKFAQHVIDKLNSLFPTAMAFIRNEQEKVKTNSQARDYFGRKRIFETDHYKAKNFIIQSPAATICLEKLIQLKNRLSTVNAELAFHVHDGYYLYVHKNKYRPVYKQIEKILEGPSNLCPELKLKVSCKVGPTLDEMKGEHEESI